MKRTMSNMKPIHRHPVLHRLIIMAMVALIATACRKNPETKKAGAEKAPVPVTVDIATERSMDLELHTVGTVEPVQTVSIRSQQTGILTNIAFKEGEFVTEGQLLFEIDPRSFTAELKRLEAALEKDKALKKNAEVQLKRYEELVQKEFVTQAQYDDVKTNLDVLNAQVKADQEAVENARLQLERTRITAPISGRTGTIFFHPGDVIKMNDSILVTINQIDPIQVAFSIPADRLPEIQAVNAGHKLDVYVRLSARSPERIKGFVTFFDNQVRLDTGTILMKAQLENGTGKLWPGQFVDTALVLQNDPVALTIPAQAVQVGQQGTFVYVLKSDNTVEKRTVDVARTQDNISIIAQGISVGEQVVTDGQLRLLPGSKVEIKSANPVKETAK